MDQSTHTENCVHCVHRLQKDLYPLGPGPVSLSRRYGYVASRTTILDSTPGSVQSALFHLCPSRVGPGVPGS